MREFVGLVFATLTQIATDSAIDDLQFGLIHRRTTYEQHLRGHEWPQLQRNNYLVAPLVTGRREFWLEGILRRSLQ